MSTYLFEPAAVPCGPIHRVDQVFDDPQVQARGMTMPVPHPLNDDLRLVASPLKLSATPVALRRAPPLLGEHTDEVLLEAGFDAAQIATWRAQGLT